MKFGLSWGNAAKAFFFVVWSGCLLVFLVRILRTISFTSPQFVSTTGWEEEALFSLWKFTQGQPVYNDPTQIPFSASYFNWFFYLLYGSIAKFALGFLHLQPMWIPTICRLVSLVLGLSVCGFFFLIVRETGKSWQFWSVPFVVILCFVPIINPLCAKWVLTTRPDIAALAFETLGLLLFLRYLRTNTLGILIFSSFVFYLAWSFKQVNVSAVGGAGLTLLLLRNWKALFVFSGVWFLLVVATITLGGSAYRFAAFASQGHCPMGLDRCITFTLMAFEQNPLIPTILAVITYMGVTRDREIVAAPQELTLLLTSLLALPLGILLISKAGADVNYLMPLGTWLALWFVVWAGRIHPSIFSAALVASSVLIVLHACSFHVPELPKTVNQVAPASLPKERVADRLALGTSLRTSTDLKERKLAEKLATLPGPIFVTNLYGNLPWIQPHPPNFVLAFTYYLDEQAGVQHERGGWEGLMKEGYFHTVVEEATQAGLIEPYLDHYELFLEADGWRYYRRKP